VALRHIPYQGPGGVARPNWDAGATRETAITKVQTEHLLLTRPEQTSATLGATHCAGRDKPT